MKLQITEKESSDKSFNKLIEEEFMMDRRTDQLRKKKYSHNFTQISKKPSGNWTPVI